MDSQATEGRLLFFRDLHDCVPPTPRRTAGHPHSGGEGQPADAVGEGQGLLDEMILEKFKGARIGVFEETAPATAGSKRGGRGRRTS